MQEYNVALPLLVVGIPGVPGFNAFYYFRTLFPGQVGGIAPPNAPELTAPGNPFGPGLFPVDPEDRQALGELFRREGFKTVIDASGWCALKPAELDPVLAKRLNVDIGVNVMEAAREAGARLIRLSTDLVFDGLLESEGGFARASGYSEDHPVSPVTVYGKMMADSERLILAGYPEATVLRIALPMGPSLNGHAGAIDWIESRFRKGKPATLYFDEVRSNLYVQDLNRLLLRCAELAAPGLFHAGGPRPLSLYNIAQVINKVGGYAPELLMGCPRAHAGPMPPRAGDVSMDSGKLRALFGANVLSAWPFEDSDCPSGPDWHFHRTEAGRPEFIRQRLNGYGWLDRWDHPLRLDPRVPKGNSGSG